MMNVSKKLKSLLCVGLLLGSSTQALAQVTPSTVQAGISAVPWTNGSGKVTGATLQAQFQAMHDLVAGMGTWSSGGVYSPGLGSVTSVIGVSQNGYCDTSQYNSFLNSAAPLPACFAAKINSTIATPFPGLGGINSPSGQPNDQTHIQYAGTLAQYQTSLDNTHQEAANVVNMLSKTGGGGLAQTNWNQKVGFLDYVTAVPGSSNAWGVNYDLTVLAGVGNYSFFGTEGDVSNFNGDYAPGGCNPCTGTQINGNYFNQYLTFTGYPVTAGIAFNGNPNSGSASMHIGLLFQAGSSGATAVGQGLISDATINDSSNSTDVFRIYGNHTNGLNTTLGTVGYTVLMKQSQQICWNGFDACMFYAGSNTLRYGQNGGVPLQIVGIASGANGVSITSAPNGFGPTIKSVPTGTDTNVPLNISGYGVSPTQIINNGLREISTVATGITLAGTYSTNQISGTGWSVSPTGVITAAGAKLVPTTVAALPTCNAGAETTEGYVTDATTLTYGGAPAGGGQIGTTVLCSRSGAGPTYAWTMH